MQITVMKRDGSGTYTIHRRSENQTASPKSEKKWYRSRGKESRKDKKQ